MSTGLLRALPGGGAAVLRSLVKAILVAIWVLACMVVPEHASAGCPVEPELTELSILVCRTTLGKLSSLDRAGAEVLKAVETLPELTGGSLGGP